MRKELIADNKNIVLREYSDTLYVDYIVAECKSSVVATDLVNGHTKFLECLKLLENARYLLETVTEPQSTYIRSNYLVEDINAFVKTLDRNPKELKHEKA